MRYPVAFFTCLAVLASPLLASAHDGAYGGNSGAYRNCTPDTGSLPENPYIKGDAYIVNPTDMTNTRDNRGDIVEGTVGQPHYYRVRDERWNEQSRGNMRGNDRQNGYGRNGAGAYQAAPGLTERQ